MIVALKGNQNIQKKSSFVTSSKKEKNKKTKIYLKTKRLRSVLYEYCTWRTISLQSMQTERREPSSLSLSPARGDTMLHLLLVLKHHPVI
jgi:hypothetical protein